LECFVLFGLWFMWIVSGYVWVIQEGKYFTQGLQAPDLWLDDLWYRIITDDIYFKEDWQQMDWHSFLFFLLHILLPLKETLFSKGPRCRLRCIANVSTGV
jgi:hypothetical protein